MLKYISANKDDFQNELQAAQYIVATRKRRLINKFGSELTLLLDLPTEKFRKNDFDIIAEAIDRMRQGNVFKNAGYDGLYGNVRLFSQTEINKIISGKF